MKLFDFVSELLGTKRMDRYVEQADQAAAAEDYALAEKAYSKALEMAEETKSWEFVGIAAYGAAVACEKQNKNVSAEKHYTKAFRTWEDSEEYDRASEALCELARLLRSQRRLQEADQYYRYALKLLQEKYQNEDSCVVSTNRKLAECLIEKKAYAEAEGLLVRLIATAEKTGAQEVAFIPNALLDLGRCHVEQGKESDAEAAFSRAFDLYAKVEDLDADKSGVKATTCAHEYARCLVRQNKVEPAKAIYSRAMLLAESHPGYLGEGELIDEAGKYTC
jgi:tetratricopeptide (TPR) repeat protein